MKTYYLALDLKDDRVLIRQYENLYEKIWPEIAESIKDSGILEMKIYRVSNRLFMVMETQEPGGHSESFNSVQLNASLNKEGITLAYHSRGLSQ